MSQSQQTTSKQIICSILAIIAIFTFAILVFEHLGSLPEPQPKRNNQVITGPNDIHLSVPGDTLIIQSIKHDSITLKRK